MPWTVKDVDSKKKGLTPAQKKKWVSIANSVLKSCKAKGGKNCDAQAIKVANSKFEERAMAHEDTGTKVPKGALRFVGEGQQAFAESEEGKSPKMKMTVYNGKIIKDHWYWDDLAIDLDGMKFSAGKFPILENHDTRRKIAFHSGKPDISDNKLELYPEKVKFVDTEHSAEFIKLSGDGFPYQASMYAKPTEIQRLSKDETTDVNGFKMKGPGTVWRKCQFKEASVCVFGWDSETKASAFSREALEEVDYVENKLEEDKFEEEGGEIMNLSELKTTHPDLVAELSAEVTAATTVALSTEFDKERAKFTAEKAALEDKNANAEDRLAGLEKKDALREERERETTADRMWSEKLSVSGISSHLFDKVKRMVSFTKFIKDDALDTVAFATAIDGEIADWEKRTASDTVSGLGIVGRKETGNEKTAVDVEANKKLSTDLLSRAGQTE